MADGRTQVMSLSSLMAPSTATPTGIANNTAGIAAVPTAQSATARGTYIFQISLTDFY